MTHELEKLVHELCAFDSELAKDPKVIRHIVEELEHSKPGVVIDDAFRTRLRSELMRTYSNTKPVPNNRLPWWVLYTAPLGVTALLLIIIRPALTPPSDIAPLHTPETATGDMMKMGPTTADDANSREATGDMLQTNTMQSNTDYFTASIANETVLVTYLTTTQPSYIVVTDSASAVLAVSELLNPGEHTSYTFTARTSFASGTIYTATLHYDNGDGVYTQGDDVSATDMSGVPLSLLVALP